MANHKHGFRVKDQVRETFPAFYKKDEILTIFALNKFTATVHDILGVEELIDYRMLKKVPIVKPKKDKPQPPKKTKAKPTKKAKVPDFTPPDRRCKTDMCDGERLLYGHYCQKCNDLSLPPPGAPPVEGIGPPPEDVRIRCPSCKEDKVAIGFRKPTGRGSKLTLCEKCANEKEARQKKGEKKRKPWRKPTAKKKAIPKHAKKFKDMPSNVPAEKSSFDDQLDNKIDNAARELAQAVKDKAIKAAPVDTGFFKGKLQIPGHRYKERTLKLTIVTDPDDPAIFDLPTMINVYRCKNEHGSFYILANSFADAESEFKRTKFGDDPISIKHVCRLNKYQAIFYLNNYNQEELDKCP